MLPSEYEQQPSASFIKRVIFETSQLQITCDRISRTLITSVVDINLS
jgi:hypothetical protein